MKTLVCATVLSGLLLMASPLAALAQATSASADHEFDTTTLTVSASGEIRVAPDQATVKVGVLTSGRTAKAATQENVARMTQVVDALRGAGIAEKAIQTSSVGVEGQYVDQPNEPHRLTGYRASNTVTITVDDLPKLGALLDTATAAGANRIDGVSFGLKNPGSAEDAARVAAVKALTAKADLYARATGYRAARLVRLSEGGDITRAQHDIVGIESLQDMTNFTPGMILTTPVSPGELTIRVSLSGFYELVR